MMIFKIWVEFAANDHQIVQLVVQSHEIHHGIESMELAQKFAHVNLVHGHRVQGLLICKWIKGNSKAQRIFSINWRAFSALFYENIDFLSRSEEIPMEDFRQSRNSSPSSRCSSRGTSRSHTPSRLGANETLTVPTQEHQTLSNSPNLLAAASATLAEDNSSNANSVETSFIAPKKKGAIETVWT